MALPKRFVASIGRQLTRSFESLRSRSSGGDDEEDDIALQQTPNHPSTVQSMDTIKSSMTFRADHVNSETVVKTKNKEEQAGLDMRELAFQSFERDFGAKLAPEEDMIKVRELFYEIYHAKYHQQAAGTQIEENEFAEMAKSTKKNQKSIITQTCKQLWPNEDGNNDLSL